jgi:hypothetical protein
MVAIDSASSAGPIGARHAITAETDGRYREISIAESAAFHKRAPSITGIISELGVEKRRLSDIKPGDFIASGGVRGTDGQIHAVELRLLPESMRGVAKVSGPGT